MARPATAGVWKGSARCFRLGATSCIISGFTITNGNAGAGNGGGTLFYALTHCTVTGNSAGGDGGGMHSSLLVQNSIVYFNTATGDGANWYESGSLPSEFIFCCMTPAPGPLGHLEEDPQFVNATAGDYRLRALSPCIDAAIGLFDDRDDLDGVRRPLDSDGDGRVQADMGAYEYVHRAADSDGDGVEWQILAPGGKAFYRVRGE